MPDATTPEDSLVNLVGDTLDNRANLRRLISQLRTPLGVIPFIGAGLSGPFGYPPWAEFLRDEARKAGLEQSIEERIQRSEYEDAAQDLLGARGNRAFNDAISDTFSIQRIAAVAITGPAALLPRLATGPVVTTNFDQLLEEAFRRANSNFEHVVWGARAELATQALQENRRFLLKIHGDAADRTDRVLTRDDYDSQYGRLADAPVDFRLPVPRLLLQMLMGRPLLFLGCSLAADRTMAVLQGVAEYNPSLAHYAIVPAAAELDELHQRAKFLSDRNIRPIWYPTGRHDLIEPLLHGLLNAAVAPGQALRLIESAQAALGTLDPHYLVQLTGINERQFTIAVHERNLEEAPTRSQAMRGVLSFPDTPEGTRHREQLEQSMAIGAPVEIPGEFVERIDIPEVITKLFGEHTLNVTTLRLVPIVQLPQPVVRIDVATDDGETFALPFVQLRAQRNDAEQMVLENSEQPMPIRVRLTLDNAERSATINFSFAGPPVNVSQALEWLKLRRCLSKNVTVRLSSVDSGLSLVEQHWPDGINEAPPNGWIEEFADLQLIQAKVHMPITVPEGNWSDQDRFAIGRLRTILHEGRVTGRWTADTLTGPAAGARAFLEHLGPAGRKWLIITRDDTEQLFGLVLPLGAVRMTYQDVKLADEEGLRQQLAQIEDDETEVQVRIVPGEDQTILWEYLDWLPDDVQGGEQSVGQDPSPPQGAETA